MLILQLFICCGASAAVSDGAEETVGFSVCCGTDCAAFEEDSDTLCGGCADSSKRLSSELSLCTEETDGTADDALSESGRRTLHDAKETAKNKHNNIDISFFIYFVSNLFKRTAAQTAINALNNADTAKSDTLNPSAVFGDREETIL